MRLENILTHICMCGKITNLQDKDSSLISYEISYKTQENTQSMKVILVIEIKIKK